MPVKGLSRIVTSEKPFRSLVWVEKSDRKTSLDSPAAMTSGAGPGRRSAVFHLARRAGSL